MSDFLKMIHETENQMWKSDELDLERKRFENLCKINDMLRDRIIELEEIIRVNSYISKDEYRSIMKDVIIETLKERDETK